MMKSKMTSLDTFFFAHAQKNTRDERRVYDHSSQNKIPPFPQNFSFLYTPNFFFRSSRVFCAAEGEAKCIEGRKKLKNNLGFSLIEVVIALLISSILGIALFTSFNQINKYANIANNVMSADTRLATIHHQLTKDISGSFILIQALPPESKKEDQNKSSDKQSKNQEQPQPKDTEKKEQYKQLKKIFVSTNGENNTLKTITFITNNPLVSYGNAKPRIARVMYRLAQSKGNKEIFTLYRQESTTELEVEKFKPENKKIREFAVADNIKSLILTFEAPQGENEELQEFKEWDSDKKIQQYVKQKKEREKKDKKNAEKKEASDKKASADKQEKDAKEKNSAKEQKTVAPFYALPQYVTFELELWETAGKGEISSKGMIFIPASAIIEPPVAQEMVQTQTKAPQGPPLPPSIVKLFGPGSGAAAPAAPVVGGGK